MIHLPIVKDKFIVIPLVVGLALLIVGFSVAYNQFVGVRNLLIIHFDSFQGIDFLGDKSDVFKILGLGIIVLCLDSFLASVFYWRERFLSYLLTCSAAIFSLLILIAVLAIIFIN